MIIKSPSMQNKSMFKINENSERFKIRKISRENKIVSLNS
jgi:hypothetical protein